MRVGGHLESRMGEQETGHVLKTVPNVISNNFYLIMLVLFNLREWAGKRECGGEAEDGEKNGCEGGRGGAERESRAYLPPKPCPGTPCRPSPQTHGHRGNSNHALGNTATTRRERAKKYIITHQNTNNVTTQHVMFTHTEVISTTFQRVLVRNFSFQGMYA